MLPRMFRMIRRFAGDIKVFEDTPAVTKIYLDYVKCTGTTFLLLYFWIPLISHFYNVHR